jgi:hypothetical protein
LLPYHALDISSIINIGKLIGMSLGARIGEEIVRKFGMREN